MSVQPLGGRRKVPNGWALVTLDEINDGFTALKRGETIRTVITFD